MRRVLIIDYDLNNLRSLSRAVAVCGGEPKIVTRPDQLIDPTHVIIPGVGNFTKAMEVLESRGWPEVLRKLGAAGSVQILGICLGMQLLAASGSEGGKTRGIGLIEGDVERLDAKTTADRIPHVGWNEVRQVGISPLFRGIPDLTDFYFVHSYHFVVADNDCVIGTTPYCGGFTAAVQRQNVFGVQFHPEKSSRPGLRLLENFIGIERQQ